MRKPNVPAVPLTKDNFEDEYKIATGLNFIGVEWIQNHTPENESDKYIYLAKLIRNIQLNLDRWVDGELNKYGRFRITVEYPDPESENGPKTLEECEKIPADGVQPSALVEMLQEIIFDGFAAQYLLGDDGAYILTHDGQKILI